MITFNPTAQTTALGSFTLESDGLVCGTAYPDPSSRFRLAGGWLSTDELLPMWGGVAISENTPSYQPSYLPSRLSPAGDPARLRASPAGAWRTYQTGDQRRRHHRLLGVRSEPLDAQFPRLSGPAERPRHAGQFLPLRLAGAHRAADRSGGSLRGRDHHGGGGFTWNYDKQWIDAWGRVAVAHSQDLPRQLPSAGLRRRADRHPSRAGS